jgi:hypothetical protein
MAGPISNPGPQPPGKEMLILRNALNYAKNCQQAPIEKNVLTTNNFVFFHQ